MPLLLQALYKYRYDNDDDDNSDDDNDDDIIQPAGHLLPRRRRLLQHSGGHLRTRGRGQDHLPLPPQPLQDRARGYQPQYSLRFGQVRPKLSIVQIIALLKKILIFMQKCSTNERSVGLHHGLCDHGLLSDLGYLINN